MTATVEATLDGGQTRNDERSRRVNTVIGIAAVNVVIIAVFSLTTPDNVFFQAQTFTSVVLNASQVVLLGVGLSCLLGAGELDISLGANLVLSSVLGAKAMNAVVAADAGLLLSLVAGGLVCVLSGAVFGFLNGFVVVKLRVSSFIATLGMLGVGSGLALVITGGADLSVPTQLQSGFGIRSVAGVPLPAVLTGLLAVIVFLLMTRTKFGLRAVAIGSSRQAAARAGIPVDRTVILLFVMAGALAGVAGLIDLSRFTTTSVSAHQTDALSAIAGAVIGGTALYGGRVSIGGTVLGCLLPTILQIGLVLQGLPPFYQQVAVGLVLIAAVAMRAAQLDQDGAKAPRGRPRLRRRPPFAKA